MAVKVIRLHIEYGALGNRLWRDVEVSDKYTLAKLAYTILATFDTCAYHQFEYYIDKTNYAIPVEDDLDDMLNCEDVAAVKLADLHLTIGKTFIFNYDYGTTQTFNISVVSVENMGVGQGTAYPKVVAGEGRGIIDDYSEDELTDLIDEIDKNGKTKKDIYYKDRKVAWNINSYDMKADNALLKLEVKTITDAYAPFWEEQ